MKETIIEILISIMQTILDIQDMVILNFGEMNYQQIELNSINHKTFSKSLLNLMEAINILHKKKMLKN